MQGPWGFSNRGYRLGDTPKGISFKDAWDKVAHLNARHVRLTCASICGRPFPHFMRLRWENIIVTSYPLRLCTGVLIKKWRPNLPFTITLWDLQTTIAGICENSSYNNVLHFIIYYFFHSQLKQKTIRQFCQYFWNSRYFFLYYYEDFESKFFTLPWKFSNIFFRTNLILIITNNKKE